ncbi:hypothetical protein AD945_01840 [Gluconobacter albidus]|uniref:DUF3486 family protein n=1 Tax=Gluconobacter albidus TaxID=318683 RepID=A0A149TMS8_9PROT|nr:DUF3486 family protein [Gluconobacter albidus]KXV50546.1 hypothetical protein AD945_01840 [Gluconobacter albidus]
MAERPSSIDKLPQEVRDEIASLRGAGHTIDEILAALRELHSTEISRSALGRHIKTMEEVGRDMRQSREIAEMLVRQLGDEPESRVVQANIQLMHSFMMKLFIGDDEAIREIKKDPQSIMMMAKALDHLTRSSKTDADFVAKVEARVEARIRAETEARLKTVVKEKGMTAETATIIRNRVLGMKS